MKRVEIEWVDSRMAFCGWENEDEACDFELSQCKTTGYVIKETEDEIIVVSSYGGGLIAGKSIIPKGCIKRIKDG